MNLEDYLPNIVKEVREFAALMATENTETTDLHSAIQSVFNDQFATTLTENGCKRWESIMSIKPLDTDTIDIRRYRILARLNEQLPYTERNLEQRLADLCGEDGYEIALDKPNYKLKVRIALDVKKKYDEVEKMLDRTTPCNLVLDISLLYNKWNMVSEKTWGAATNITWKQIREEVV